MADTVRDRVGLFQGADQTLQHTILTVLKGYGIAALELDSDREVITALASVPLRNPGVPGAFRTGNELNELAVAPNQKMGGNPQTSNLVEIGVGGTIETVGKQRLDRIPTKSARWQTDAVNDHQIDGTSGRAGITVGRRDLARSRQHASGVNYPVAVFVHLNVHKAACFALN